MSKEVVETIYGKYNKYEIMKEVTGWGNIKFYIYKDGKYHASYESLKDAVEAAKKAG